MTTTAPRAATRPAVRTAALPALVLVAAAVGLVLPAVGLPLDRDAAAYATVGAHLGPDALPYVAFFDHKQPLVYVVFALLDVLGPGSAVPAHLLAGLLAATAGEAVRRILLPVVGGPVALAGGLVAVLVAVSTTLEGFALNTEHLLLAASAVAMAHAVAVGRDGPTTRQAAVGGALFAVVVCAKAVGVLLLPALVLALLHADRRPVRRLVAYALGAAVPVALVTLLYAVTGHVDDLLFANGTYNRLYVGAPFADLPGKLAEHVGIWALAGAGVLALALGGRLRADRDGLGVPVLLWLLGALAGALLGPGLDAGHYYVPLAAPAGVALGLAWGAARTDNRALAAAALAAAAVAPFAVADVLRLGQAPEAIATRAFDARQARQWADAAVVGRRLRALARPGDRLFVAGSESGYYAASGLRPAARFFYDYPRVVTPGRYRRSVVADLCRPGGLPRFVVVPAGQPPAVARCLSRAPYRLLGDRPASRSYVLGRLRDP